MDPPPPPAPVTQQTTPSVAPLTAPRDTAPPSTTTAHAPRSTSTPTPTPTTITSATPPTVRALAIHTATTTTTTTTTAPFPRLTSLDPSSSAARPHRFRRPAKRIHTGADLPHFLASRAYRDIGAFVLQLDRALCPRKEDGSERGGKVRTFPTTLGQSYDGDGGSGVVAGLRAMLTKLEDMVDEVPPETGPRRFGNAAFRKWYALLEERAEGLLREGVLRGVWERWQGKGGAAGDGDGDGGGEDEDGVMAEVKAYFLGAWGSAERLDYGTGHELSFLAFLGCLWKLGAFGEEENGTDGEVERRVVLGVFEPYLKVVRRLILTYNLEPAGTHGVWGLDDHSFLPYIFGSAQLTRAITDTEPMPLEGSVAGAPRPTDVIKPETVDLYRDSNMYFAAIGFINDVKKGPFWEHSPILFDVSGIKDGWGKINKGMIKMFNAEVLSKFPVVQHFLFGSLFSWDLNPEAAVPTQSAHLASYGQPSVSATAVQGTGAARPQATGMPGVAASVPSGPGIPYSRAPWAGAGSSGPTMPRGGIPETGPPPPTSFPRGKPGTASNQFSVTKAPWAKG